jgi:hypothetical protein
MGQTLKKHWCSAANLIKGPARFPVEEVLHKHLKGWRKNAQGILKLVTLVSSVWKL